MFISWPGASAAAVMGLLLGALALPLGAAAADPPPPPTVQSLTVSSQRSFDLTGTEVGTVTVEARITDPNGVVVDGTGICVGNNCLTAPLVEWGQTSGPPQARLFYPQRSFQLVSGTLQDGVWRATVQFTAWQAGATFRIAKLVVAARTSPTDWKLTPIDPAPFGVDSTVTVTGGDPPVLGVSTRPAVVHPDYRGPVTTYLLLYLRDSRRSLPGRPISYCLDSQCEGVWGDRVRSVITSDATGRASVSWRYPQAAFAAFLRQNSGTFVDQTMYMATRMEPKRPTSLSLAAPASPVASGTSVTLRGTSSPVWDGDGRRASVVVQKWVSGQWRTLGRTTVRSSGRWDYVTVPRTKGTHVYRAWRPGGACDVAGRCVLMGSTTAPVSATVR